jgi:ADP-heptose:LPS heptosyltransferase
VDVNQDYQDQLWESYIGRLQSRPHWLIRNVRKNYPTLREGIEPSRPEAVIKPDPVIGGEYIVLSPYSSVVGPSRNWPASNYAMLIHKLVKHGYRCVVVMTDEWKADEHLYTMPGSTVWINKPPREVVRLVGNAQAVIGNDSGIAHLGGLMQVPTFAIMAIVPVGITFMCADVHGIVPNPRVECRFCCWQKEGGIIPACGSFCGALATITPDDVLSDVLFQLKNQSSIRSAQKEPE